MLTTTGNKLFSEIIGYTAASIGSNVKLGIVNLLNIQIPDHNEWSYSNSEIVLEITTFTYFSNRVFKIGDNILLKGFVDSSNDTYDNNSFINREKGHYIVNLESENSFSGHNGNEGFIQKMYISSGRIRFTSETTGGVIKSGSILVKLQIQPYFDTDSSNLSTNCQLINKSLQTTSLSKLPLEKKIFILI